MATIHVARDGANIGTFSTDEVREGLRTGRFLPTDMGWEAGMPDWRPLSQMMAEQPVATALAADTSGANALPLGSTPSSGGAGGGLPWEHRQELGVVKAFVDTVVLLLTKPAEAFGMMKTEDGLMDPLFFALIGGCAGMIVAFFFQVLFHSVGIMADRSSDVFGMGLGIGVVFALISMPVLFVCGLFIWSGILHLCLMMLGGANKPFETTFRVVCFASGSTNLLAIVPFCGRVVAPIYNIVLQCMGLARAHETDTGKAVMAVLLPILVCCGAFFLLAVLGGFSALSLFNRH
jgi:hypothetical protein